MYGSLAQITRNPGPQLSDFSLRSSQPDGQGRIVVRREPSNVVGCARPGFLQQSEDSMLLFLLSRKGDPAGLRNEADLFTDRRQPLVGIVYSQVKPEFSS